VLLPSEVPTVQISFDEDGRSTGAFVVGANEKERIDIIRDSLLARGRAFIFHGPRGSGKTAMATQLAAIMRRPYAPIPSSEGAPYLASSGGEDVHVRLGPDEARALTDGLEAGGLVHLIGADPRLHGCVARALGEPFRKLILQPLGPSGHPQGEPLSAMASPAALAVFEIPGATEGVLSLDDSWRLTPISFDDLSSSAREAQATGQGYSPKGGGQPETWKDSYGDAGIKGITDALDADPSFSRPSLCEQIVGVLHESDPSFTGPEALSFVSRWLRLVEIQAHGGDGQAARTLAISVRGFVPGQDWEPRLRALVNPWASRLMEAGEASRAAAVAA
jgi:hypothetical protein